MNAIDLFAGCGGLSLGFSKAGFNVLRAYDNWTEAVKCYSLNFHHPIIQADLNNHASIIKDLTPLQFDIIVGGPPCQDFSHAGGRLEGERAGLTQSYAKIISSLKPEWYLMENVDRAYKSNAYKSARKIFKKAGYGITEIILDASFCGVPQKRKRFFSIGRMGESDNFMTSFLVSRLASKPMTLREYFGDKIDFEFYYRHPRNYNRRGIFSIDEPAPTVRGVNRPLPQGYPGHENDATKLSNKIRPLTTAERAQVQTFPKSFKFVGTKTTVEQMIGNAVPVNLARFVAKAILDFSLKECESSKETLLVETF